MGTRDINNGEAFYMPTLDMLVKALCADFERREIELCGKMISPRTEMEYKYLNAKILEAASEISGTKCGTLLIKEIGNRVGYANTEVDFLSEDCYKRQKRQIKLNIARKLHLLD